jgi:hypothetical protein
VNLLQLAAELIKADPPPLAVSAWGFGSYVRTPEVANDVDVLIVFDNAAISATSHIHDVLAYCRRLHEVFRSRSGKDLHLQRLTEKECAEVDFIGETAAVLIWSRP